MSIASIRYPAFLGTFEVKIRALGESESQFDILLRFIP